MDNRSNNVHIAGVNNRLLEDNRYLYEYDIVGNRTRRTDISTDEVMEYSWDIRDRLIDIVIKDINGEIIKSAQYKYDVYNHHIAKTVDVDGNGAAVATTERYVYGSNQRLQFESN